MFAYSGLNMPPSLFSIRQSDVSLNTSLDLEKAYTKKVKVVVSAPPSGKDGFAVTCLKLRVSKPSSWRFQESLLLLNSRTVTVKSPPTAFQILESRYNNGSYFDQGIF